MDVIRILYLTAKIASNVFDTMISTHVAYIRLGKTTLSVMKSYTYLGHIIIDTLYYEAGTKAKEMGFCGRCNVLLNLYSYSEPVRNNLFTCHLSNLCLCFSCAKNRMPKYYVCLNLKVHVQ